MKQALVTLLIRVAEPSGMSPTVAWNLLIADLYPQIVWYFKPFSLNIDRKFVTISTGQVLGSYPVLAQ